MEKLKLQRWMILVLLVVVIANTIVAELTRAQVDHSEFSNLAAQVASLNIRTAVLENNMSEILWLVRAGVAGVLGQLGIMLFIKKRDARTAERFSDQEPL